MGRPRSPRRHLELKGKCAVVTGASRGIGRAIALRFAQEGANVAICARNETALQAAEKELCEWGTKVWAAVCDVVIRQALDQFLESAHHTLGRVDILVNNATAFGFADDETGWQSSFEVDVMAAVRGTWKVVPWMSANGGGCAGPTEDSGECGRAGAPRVSADSLAGQRTPDRIDEFLQLQTVLHEHFEAVTKRVIAQAIGTEDADVELRQGPALEA